MFKDKIKYVTMGQETVCVWCAVCRTAVQVKLVLGQTRIVSEVEAW